MHLNCRVSLSKVVTQNLSHRVLEYMYIYVQTLVNCHCQLEENPVGNVEPMLLVVQYLTQAAFKLLSAGDNTLCSVQHPL